MEAAKLEKKTKTIELNSICPRKKERKRVSVDAHDHELLLCSSSSSLTRRNSEFFFTKGGPRRRFLSSEKKG